MKTQIHKIPIKLYADPKRVITLPSLYPGLDRVKRIYQRIAAMSDENADSLLQEINRQFGHRHKKIESHYLSNYNFFKEHYASSPELSELKKLLLGASLTKEYSIQSAALFNPSMVPHPDQSGLKNGQKRFVISLRSTGEGHISSIEFRSGIVDEEGNLSLDETSQYSLTGEVFDPEALNYKLRFPDESLLSERVIYPQTESESMGMEDLRLVLFDEEEKQTYYGTYTAYNGTEIKSQLLETKDFLNFQIHSLMGNAVVDKGMAVFPEKINGKYAIISRQGGENISIMFSEDLFHWEEAQLLMEPKYPFEISQIGNCGSPIKTEKGWLLLTHGVGPMRLYTIGVALLDLKDPTKVISSLDRPLIWAEGDEREGYVPNVVYSCGGMLHGKILFIPYAMSDSMTGFAW
ncbi:MAG: glycoside hydrolase family 130 protein, partial [Desulfobacterales bacterium]|nr:glycoside hydrolase family 130 protein [Desulfobacterales bacterium]